MPLLLHLPALLWAAREASGLPAQPAGSAALPCLQVAPLFAIHGLPKTPEDGESFVGGPGSEMTRSELQVGLGTFFQPRK